MPLPSSTSLGLPAKPGSLSALATSSTPTFTSTPTPSSSSTPASSSSATTKCAMCPTAAKYTCPRCAARTCSLVCSKAHKEKRGCSGVRDPAAFVPLAKYTQGTWDGDYAWLEGTRRQVAAFGEGISAEEAAPRGVDRGRGRGRGGRGGSTARPRKSKLDGLRWAVSQVGAEVDVLPDGMQRRRQNQSSWNPKSHALFLTLQLVPSGRLAAGSSKTESGETASAVEGDKDKDRSHQLHYRVPVLPSCPTTTLTSLLPEHLRSTADLIFALPYHIPRRRQAELANPGRGAFFPPLPSSEGLDTALHGTAFIEYPVIQVWARDEWDGMLRAGMVRVMPGLQPPRKEAEAEKERPAKKARVEPGVNALAGLGDYGDSDEGSDEEESSGAGERAAEVEGTGEGEGGGDAAGEGDEGTVDITLDPAMAAALGQALVADFGTVE